ncbi:hypothetical protein AVEN_175514-1 [Araneus ventricosus]|uniref:Uncharacterized protein n=1 Tax=Araneus ventricosus TaxID=182803 RepID=A0A4Y2WIG3_ARAVE|nr:hypothetical protein AVEN_175514-1 [Araneus ventricosus]
MVKEEYEEWMSIDEDIPVAVILTDLEFCQAACEQDQAINVDDFDGDKSVEENPLTNVEVRQALNILKHSMQHCSTNFNVIDFTQFSDHIKRQLLYTW